MESLVHAMLNNALASALLAILVAIVAWNSRKPALVHSLWLIVLLKLVTPPAILLPLPGIDKLLPPLVPPAHSLDDRVALSALLASSSPGTRENDADGPVAETRLEILPVDVANVPGARANSEERLVTTDRPVDTNQRFTAMLSWKWEHWLLIVFSSGALARWSLSLIRIARFQRLLRDLEPVTADWQSHANTLANQIGLRGSPGVYLVPGRLPPLIWALGGRPKILVPSALWSATEEDERMTLVLHELAHLKRHDHWVRWFEFVVGGLYWWNPVVWWTCSRLREAEEQCCDAWVVWAMPRRARTYAAALLTVLDFVSGVPTAPALASAMGGGRHVSCLKRRLLMIVSAKTPKGLSWAGWSAVVGLATLLLPLSPSWAQQADAGQRPNQPPRVTPLPANRAKSMVGVQRASRVTTREQDDRSQAKDREVAERFEGRVRDLIDKLAKEVGPVTDEIRKALESAVNEIHKSLEKEDLSADDVRKSLEKSHEDMRRAFERGGPVEKEVREAWARSRQELRDAWDRTRDDLRETVRDRTEPARQQQRATRDRAQADRGRDRDRATTTPDEGKIKEGEGQPGRNELESAQNEVQELRRQLTRATQRLQELQRRDRDSRRSQPPRREPSPRAEPAPSRNPGTPRAEPAPAAPPRSPGGPPAPAPFARPAPSRGGQAQPRVAPGGARREPQSGNDRRLRQLEDKMNQLLKELKELKDEQKKETKAPTGDVTQLASPITPF
jgi:beta-lactamase regulating signal transducer with metallopeptidase domain